MRKYAAGLVDTLSPDHDGMKHVTVTYYDPATLNVVRGQNSNIGGNIVVVSISGLSWSWMVPLLHDNKAMTFALASADVMEASPIGGPPAR